MELSYPLRLTCLIAVSMGVLQTAFELLLWLCAPLLLRLLRPLALRHQERALYALQLAPFTFSLGVTACLWVPQYVSSETNFAAEAVGWACLVLTASLSAWWVTRAVRGLQVTMRTVEFTRACRQDGRAVATEPGATPVIAMDGAAPRAGLVGLVRPFIFISRSLLEGGLDPAALRLVFDHERSHAAQRDNWKLLALHCLPRLNLRLASGKTWMQHWQNAAESAADEDAVRGDRMRALLLAETLLAMARSASAARPRVACTYFVCDQSELAARIDRLIEVRPQAPAVSGCKLGLTITLVLAATLIALANAASALHDLPERLLHLG